LLTNIAYFFLLSPSQIGSSSRVASDAIGVVFGPTGSTIIALAIFVSTFGTAGIYTLTAPRIYYAMASDGLFFRKVSEVHPKYHTPSAAIIIQSFWAVALILFWGTFENLISYVVFTDWIFFALAASSIFIFRRRLPNLARPYKALGYPITPAFFVLASVWFVVNTLLEKPEQAVAGVGFLALGVPVYYYWKTKNRNLSINRS
jgi:APA family basic amino acid/polyamine antiporter